MTLEDVAQENYLLLDMDEHVQTVGKYWGKYGVQPRVRMQSKSIEAVRILLRSARASPFFRTWCIDRGRWKVTASAVEI